MFFNLISIPGGEVRVLQLHTGDRDPNGTAAGLLKRRFIDLLLCRLFKVTEIPNEKLLSTHARILKWKF